MEAVPTVFILFIMYFIDSSITEGGEKNFLNISGDTMFWITFSISVFSASVGIAKFLKVGPCQIVPSDKLHCGFLLLFLSIVFCLLGKGFVIALCMESISLSETMKDKFIYVITILICTCMMPQLIFVSKAI